MAQQVFQPSAARATTPSSRSPLPPTHSGGRGRCTRPGGTGAPSAGEKRPSNGAGPGRGPERGRPPPGGLLEQGQPLPRPGERQPVLGELGLVPAGPEPQVEPAP